MNTVIRSNRNKTAAMLVVGLMLMNAQSATTGQPPAQLAAVDAAASHYNQALIREDRVPTGPIIRDDECNADTPSADQHRRNVIISRLP